jgi:hypothetical protein
MIVVDTDILSALAKVGRLALLGALFPDEDSRGVGGRRCHESGGGVGRPGPGSQGPHAVRGGDASGDLRRVTRGGTHSRHTQSGISWRLGKGGADSDWYAPSLPWSSVSAADAQNRRGPTRAVARAAQGRLPPSPSLRAFRRGTHSQTRSLALAASSTSSIRARSPSPQGRSSRGGSLAQTPAGRD